MTLPPRYRQPLHHRLLAACAVALLLAGCSSTPPPDAAQTPAPDLTSAPADLTWRTINGVSVPESGAAGPHSGSGTARHGYAATPQGAVLAAINAQASLALADDRSWPDTVNTVTAPGPGRDEFAVARAAVTVTGSVPAAAAPTFVGFRITDYRTDPATAAVSVAQSIGSPARLFSYPAALQWIDGDWRLVLPTAADNIDATEIASLDGYTPLEHTS